MNPNALPALEDLRTIEAQRRLELLGPIANQKDCSRIEINQRAHAVNVPNKSLRDWYLKLVKGGLEALKPEWQGFDETSLEIALSRFRELGQLADAVYITQAQKDAHAQSTGVSQRRLQRLLRDYRAGGLWGLTPRGHPEKSHPKKSRAVDLGALNEQQIQEIYRKREVLGWLGDRSQITNTDVNKRAEETGVSKRTLWYYHGAYQKEGWAGLAAKERSDKGKSHSISERMKTIIRGIRLTKPDWLIPRIYEKACQAAKQVGEPEPSAWQVRQICRTIPEPDRLLAAGRYKEFRNRFRITYRMLLSGELLIYQMDDTVVDVLIKDLRSPDYRSPSGEIRPNLLTIFAREPRVLVAAVLSYDKPDRFTVAAAIRDALMAQSKKPYGGAPDQIWCDNGKAYISDHVRQFIKELGDTELMVCDEYSPQQKAEVERFFGTLNTELWSTLDGYVDSNVVKRNPHAKAKYTLAQLEKLFWKYVDETYHQRVHQSIGVTPLEYWQEHCFTEPMDPRALDVLLMVHQVRKMGKEGIKYEGRLYWNQALGPFVGSQVVIRAAPHYSAPDEIEVFYEGTWKCTAFATDSEAGNSVSRADVASAQRLQTSTFRTDIANAQAAVPPDLFSDGLNEQPDDSPTEPQELEKPTDDQNRPKLKSPRGKARPRLHPLDRQD